MTVVERILSSPFSEPDERWKVCEQIVRGDRPEEPGCCPAMARAVRYLRAGNDSSLPPQDAALRVAHRLYLDGRSMIAFELKAWLMAGLSDADIVTRMFVRCPVLTAETVALFSDLFFDVRSRPRAFDWRLGVVGVHRWRTEPITEGDVWLYLAMYGGVIPLQLQIDDFYGKTSAEEHRQAEKARFLAAELSIPSSDLKRIKPLLDGAAEIVAREGTDARTAAMTEQQIAFLRMAASPRKGKPKSAKRHPLLRKIKASLTAADVCAASCRRADPLFGPLESGGPLRRIRSRRSTGQKGRTDRAAVPSAMASP